MLIGSGRTVVFVARLNMLLVTIVTSRIDKALQANAWKNNRRSTKCTREAVACMWESCAPAGIAERGGAGCV